MKAWRLRFVFAAMGLGTAIACLASAPANASQRISLAQPSGPPRCEFLSTQPEGLTVHRRIELEAAEGPVTSVHFMLALDTIAIQFAAKQHTAVDISYKTIGDRVFRRLCEQPGPEGQGSGLLLVQDPAVRAPALWRFEFSIDARSHQRLALLRSADSDTYLGVDPTARADLSEAAGLLCLQDLHGSAATERRRAGFAGKVLLDVSTGSNDFPLSPAQRARTRDEILQATVLWLYACSACRSQHLAVVKVDGELFVREPVLSWYEAELTGGSSEKERSPVDHSLDCPPGASAPVCTEATGGESLHRLEGELTSALEPYIVLRAGGGEAPTAKGLARYVGVGPAKERFRALCELETSKPYTPTVWSVQKALCSSQELDRREVARITILFRDGTTACGDDDNVIACRADSELTEYNAAGYRFRFQRDSGEPVEPVGRGPVELSLLHALVHEMGHWIGLEHIDGGESIMAASLRSSRCIDSSTVASLHQSLGTRRRRQPAHSAFTLNPTKRGEGGAAPGSAAENRDDLTGSQ